MKSLLLLTLVSVWIGLIHTQQNKGDDCYRRDVSINQGVKIEDANTKKISGWDGKLLGKEIDHHPKDPWDDKPCRGLENEGISKGDYKSCIVLLKMGPPHAGDPDTSNHATIHSAFGICSRKPTPAGKVTCTPGDCYKEKMECRCRYPFKLDKSKMILSKDEVAAVVKDIFVIRQCWGNKDKNDKIPLSINPSTHKAVFPNGGRLVIDSSKPKVCQEMTHKGGCSMELHLKLDSFAAGVYELDKKYTCADTAEKDKVSELYCARSSDVYKCHFSYPFGMAKENVKLTEDVFHATLKKMDIQIVSCYTGSFKSPKIPWREGPSDGVGALWSDALKARSDSFVLGEVPFCSAEVKRDGEEVLTTHRAPKGKKAMGFDPGCQRLPAGGAPGPHSLDCTFALEEVKKFKVEEPDRDHIVHLNLFAKCHHLTKPYIVPNVEDWDGKTYDKDSEVINCPDREENAVSMCSAKVRFTSEAQNGLEFSHSCAKTRAHDDTYQCSCSTWATSKTCSCEYKLSTKPGKVTTRAYDFFRNPLTCFSGGFTMTKAECLANGGSLWKEGLAKVKCVGSLHCTISISLTPSSDSISVSHGCAPLAQLTDKMSNWTSDWDSKGTASVILCQWASSSAGASCVYKDATTPSLLKIDKGEVKDEVCGGGGASVTCFSGSFQTTKDDWEGVQGSLWKKEGMSGGPCQGSKTCTASIIKTGKDIGQISSKCTPPSTVSFHEAGANNNDLEAGEFISCAFHQSGTTRSIVCRYKDTSQPTSIKVSDPTLRARLWAEGEDEGSTTSDVFPLPEDTTNTGDDGGNKGKTDGGHTLGPPSKTTTDSGGVGGGRSELGDDGDAGGRIVGIVLGILSGSLILLLACVYCVKVLLKCWMTDNDDSNNNASS